MQSQHDNAQGIIGFLGRRRALLIRQQLALPMIGVVPTGR